MNDPKQLARATFLDEQEKMNIEADLLRRKQRKEAAATTKALKAVAAAAKVVKADSEEPVLVALKEKGWEKGTHGATPAAGWWPAYQSF